MELHANHFNRIISLGYVGGNGGWGEQGKVSGGICCFFRPSTETETKTETETETPSGMRRTDPDPLAEDTDLNLDAELTRVQLAHS